MTKKQEAEKQEAVERLRGLVMPGDTIYTILRHISSSGMYRAIDTYLILPYETAYPPDDGRVKRYGSHYPELARKVAPMWISSLVARACGFRFDERREAIGAPGAGMDMGFHIVYALSHVLFRDGFDCIGEGCPSNDHSNGDRDYSKHRHSDPGYALKHAWLS